MFYTIAFYYSLAGVSSFLSFIASFIAATKLLLDLWRFVPFRHRATNCEDFLKVAYFRAAFLQDIGLVRDFIRRIRKIRRLTLSTFLLDSA